MTHTLRTMMNLPLLAIALLATALLYGCGGGGGGDAAAPPPSNGNNGDNGDNGNNGDDGDNGNNGENGNNGNNGGNNMDPMPLSGISELTDEQSRSGKYTTVSGTDGHDSLRLNGACISGAVTLRGGADSFVLRGTSRVSGTVNGGAGIDTFIWEGGTLGEGDADTLDLTRLEDFERLFLRPAASIGATVTADDLTAALNLNANNSLELGPGITFNPSEAFDFGGGVDTLLWEGGTVGSMDGQLDLSKFTALENLVLLPPRGVQQSFRGEDIVAALNIGSPNNIEMYTGVSIDSTLNAGAGHDSFFWFGGTVGAGADDSIDFALLQGFERVQLGPLPTTLPVKAVNSANLTGKGISSLSLGERVSVSGTATLTNIESLFVGGTLGANVSGTGGVNIYTLRGTVDADLNLMGGNDTVELGPGNYMGSWDGGLGNDTIRTLPGANADDIDLCDVTLTSFEAGNLKDSGSGSSVCMGSMSFRTLSLQVGESSPRLEIRGDVAAGIELEIDRSYDIRSTDLRRPDALVVGGQNGRFNTDGTAGFDCTGSRCDLLLYDRAVPLALSLSAALDAALDETLTGQQDALKPPEHRSLSSRPVSGSLSQSGTVAWSLDTRSRLNGNLSGAELSGQWRLGRGLGLRHDAAAVHLDVNTSGLSSYGGYQITGRITGTDHRLSVLWGDRQSRLGLTTQLAHYRSNSVELFERPVSARLRANIAAVQLAGWHSLVGEGLLGGTALGLRASARMQSGETSLSGLDGVRVAVRSDDNKPQWRAGLIGTINPVTQFRSLAIGWSVDYVSMGNSRSAEVLNDRQSDLVRWQQPEEFMQYRLSLSGRLSQRSNVRFELQRQDALDAPAAGWRRDYSARLSFHARF